MTITIILGVLIGIMLIAGVLLFTQQWRRRHAVGTPRCGKCRYDLRAQGPTAEKCPECGVELGPQSIRYAWEFERPQRVVVAVCLGAIALGMASVVKPLGQGDLDGLKPLWLLRWEARYEREDYAGRAAGEICGRIGDRGLDNDTVFEIVDQALALQSDRSIEWKPWYGNMVEAAQASRYDDPKRWQRYLNQAIMVHFSAAKEVCAGQTWSVEAAIRPHENRFSEPRASYIQSDSAVLQLRQAQIGGKYIASTREGYIVPATLAPGTYEAKVVLSI